MSTFRCAIPLIIMAFCQIAHAAEPIRLPNNPSLSPDGKTLVFDWNGDIWSVASTGGVAKPLTTNSARDTQPKFSPNGQQIAFISDRNGGNQVFVMPAIGGTPRQVTFNSAGFTLLEWTPDGKGLLVESTRDGGYGRRASDRLFVIPLSTDPKARPAEQMVFDDYASAATISPNGQSLLFNREGTERWRKGYKGSQGAQVWVYNRDSKAFNKLIDDGFNNFWPLWNPKGDSFYYVSGANKTYNLMESNGKATRQITKYTDDGVVTPCISRDGSTIVFRQLFDFYRIEPGKNEVPSKIEILRDDDRPIERIDRRVLTTATQCSFTPDGLEIAFIAGGDVWVMDTELREPKRITRTPEEERGVVFAPDGKSILFVSDMNGKSDIYRATRGDESKLWLQQDSFKIEPVTSVGDVLGSIKFSPDGTKIAYIRNRGNLWIADADGKEPKEFVHSWNAPDYDWSPDGKWMVYAVDDNDFNSDIWVKPLDNSRPEFNLSRHPYNDHSPVWSPDGKVIAWVGARDKKDNFNLHFVYLSKEDDEKSSREKSLEKAIEKLQKGRGPLAPFSKKVSDEQQPEPIPMPREQGKEPAKTEQPRSTTPVRRSTGVVIDFDGIYDRIRRVRVEPVGALLFSPDSKKIAYANGGSTYTIEIPDNLTPNLMSAQVASGAKWLRSGTIVGLVGGVPTALSAGSAAPVTTAAPAPKQGGGGRKGGNFQAPQGGGAAATASPGRYAFTAYQDVDIAKKYQAAFEMAWRIMRDNWYDSRLGNRDWNAVKAKYLPVAETTDLETLQTLVQMMLGELNGSHLGFTPGGRGGPAGVQNAEGAGASWRETTAYFGARFDPSFAGPGWKVKDTLPGTPADQKKTKLNPGDVVVAVDGKVIDNAIDPTVYLNGNPNRDVTLKVKAPDGAERDVTLRPISMAAARLGNSIYNKMIDSNIATVNKLSGGKLGYLHIKAMDESSFHRFEESLYNAGAGKEGLLIDVRENGGGSTADLLLTALTQPRHAIAVPRDGGPGYPQDRTVFASWNKPIVVLCNQNSFSNAEIFSHAIKILNRGHLVGVPTAGGVVSTGAAQIMDVGTLRLPFRGWFKIDDGEDEELNGAVPHFIVWPQPGDMAKGKDDQLAKAVEVLLKDVQDEKGKPKPTLRKSSERK
ncbi:PD40 domain-containing protein [Telmatocola sphagniphila]|uniref:Tricorn protease homolog n=1 Tax=Telmatocola sphagniphila TaxID=1123043 RepID=A0A8E6B1A9_9BACT|nr:S41 family peptidase [Telmatocola sphagniphila]QVL29907.1 PD40 domain-containing protein [Telmatocola sphagniphila]